jgi:hypothetical protein
LGIPQEAQPGWSSDFWFADPVSLVRDHSQCLLAEVS